MNPLREFKKRIEEGLRVLVVDDDAGIVSALTRELRKEGFALETFTEPAEALQAIRQREFALIISDNLMPGMTGLELLAEAAAAAPDTRRFLLTGRTELSDAIRAFNDNLLHRFIPKPWEKADLITFISEALDDYIADKVRREAGRLKDFALKKRSEQYKTTLVELKQVQTQLALREEGREAGAGWFSDDIRKLNFLVVEENDGVREAVLAALEKGGVASCKVVSNGFDAMNHVIGSAAVDVVLSDWSRTEPGGPTLLETIRKIKSLTHQPLFILVTTEESQDAVKRAIEAGVDGYIIKPFRLDSLTDQLERIQKKSQKEPDDKQAQALRNLNLLVANGELLLRAEIEGALAEMRMQNIVLVNSGKNMLRTLRDRPIDVVFYDMGLKDPEWPDLEGAILDEADRMSDPVVIITSRNSAGKETKEIRQAGLPYVSAPFSRSKISDTIMKAVMEY